MRSRLVDDGYFTTAPAGQLAELVSLPAVRAGMSRIVAAGWPATMILLYDEAWAITLHFASLVGALSGNEMSFDMLAWLVAPARGEAGFAPHRDRQPADVRGSFRADGVPKYCTAWVALGDATPDNSCMYLIPRGADPAYDDGDDDAPGAEDPLLALLRSDRAVQSIRACPLEAGGALIFSHRAMHWGSRGHPVRRAAPDGHTRGCPPRGVLASLLPILPSLPSLSPSSSQACTAPRYSLSFGCSDAGFEARTPVSTSRRKLCTLVPPGCLPPSLPPSLSLHAGSVPARARRTPALPAARGARRARRRAADQLPRALRL